jgi:hypothetical protein
MSAKRFGGKKKNNKQGNNEVERLGVGVQYDDDDLTEEERERRRRRGGGGIGLAFPLLLLALLAGTAFGLGLWAVIHELNENETGPPGANGTCPAFCFNGTDGTQGPPGTCPLSCFNGTDGINGTNGINGTDGQGGITALGMFYGLTAGTGMIGSDYAATVAVKTGAGTGRVPFPQDGPATGGVVRVDTSSFLLPAIGIYEIIFRVHTTEAGQLQLELNGVELAETTAVNMNPTLGGHPIIGNAFVTTVGINAVLAVINPPGNTPALTVTPADGASTHANAQSITIELNDIKKKNDFFIERKYSS